MRRGPAEHSTGPLTCTFAVIPILRRRNAPSRGNVPLARLERATFCSGDRRSIHPELQGLGRIIQKVRPGLWTAQRRIRGEAVGSNTCSREPAASRAAPTSTAPVVCAPATSTSSPVARSSRRSWVAMATSTSTARFRDARGSTTPAASAMATPPSAGGASRCGPWGATVAGWTPRAMSLSGARIRTTPTPSRSRAGSPSTSG